MSNENVVRSTDIDVTGYDFGNPTAPEGFDPNAHGYRDPRPGRHLVDVIDHSAEKDHEFTGGRGDQAKYYLTQLRPQFRVVEGPDAGATFIDFLPAPTAGRVMPAFQANRWANLVRSLGFDLPRGQTVPAEMQAVAAARKNPFTLLTGRRCYVTIIQATDQDGNPKLQDNGLPRMQVKLFGYESVNPTAKAGNGAPPATAAQPAASAPPVQGPFEL